jgi:hypothetical protein
VSDDEHRLIHLDRESEACIPLMTEIIEEEINARLAVEQVDFDDPAWAGRVAEIAADALLHKFQVRERTADNPLYRWDR